MSCLLSRLKIVIGSSASTPAKWPPAALWQIEHAWLKFRPILRLRLFGQRVMLAALGRLLLCHGFFNFCLGGGRCCRDYGQRGVWLRLLFGRAWPVSETICFAEVLGHVARQAEFIKIESFNPLPLCLLQFLEQVPSDPQRHRPPCFQVEAARTCWHGIGQAAKFLAFAGCQER